MLFQATAVAAFAVAASAHQMQLSSREIVGGMLLPRDDHGYSPLQTFCGMGLSCAEACGAGYQMCPSTDNSIHCYNPTAVQVCCPGGSGMSCESGYFCAGGAGGKQLCCKEGVSLEDCAKAQNFAGALTSQAPVPTTSSAPSTTAADPTTATSDSVQAQNSTVAKTSSSVSGKTTLAVTNSTASSTARVSPTPSSSPTGSEVNLSGAMAASPVGGAALALAAAVFAVMLL